MRINKSKSASNAGSAKSASKASAASSSNFAGMVSGGKSSKGVSGGSSLSSSTGIGDVSSLLALQSVDDRPSQKKDRAIRNAQELLDLLEEMKVDMLAGYTNPSSALKLTNAVAKLKDKTGEENLDEILNEIETRASVELAKLNMRHSKS